MLGRWELNPGFWFSCQNSNLQLSWPMTPCSQTSIPHNPLTDWMISLSGGCNTHPAAILGIVGSWCPSSSSLGGYTLAMTWVRLPVTQLSFWIQVNNKIILSWCVAWYRSGHTHIHPLSLHLFPSFPPHLFLPLALPTSLLLSLPPSFLAVSSRSYQRRSRWKWRGCEWIEVCLFRISSCHH